MDSTSTNISTTHPEKGNLVRTFRVPGTAEMTGKWSTTRLSIAQGSLNRRRRKGTSIPMRYNESLSDANVESVVAAAGLPSVSILHLGTDHQAASAGWVTCFRPLSVRAEFGRARFLAPIHLASVLDEAISNFPAIAAVALVGTAVSESLSDSSSPANSVYGSPRPYRQSQRFRLSDELPTRKPNSQAPECRESP